MTDEPDDGGGALLRLDGVSRTYGDVEVVRQVSLAVAPGQCVALTGDNGAGKSTLLRLAAGREHPTSGTVTFDGAPADGDTYEFRSRVATVIDPGAFYPDLTVREHLMLVALANGRADSAAEHVETLLHAHHLDAHADALPQALSSGLTQQMLLAAAFVRPHDLLLLDEPEQRLDSGARTELARRLAEHKRNGVAILLATHHTELADTAADLCLHLSDGRIDATAQDITAHAEV